MKLWKKILLSLFLVIGALVAFAISKNQPPQLAKVDYYEYYINQDTKPEGRIGIFVSCRPTFEQRPVRLKIERVKIGAVINNYQALV